MTKEQLEFIAWFTGYSEKEIEKIWNEWKQRPATDRNYKFE